MRITLVAALALLVTGCDDTSATSVGAGGAGGSTSSGSNTGAAAGTELSKPQFGDPKILSAQRITFGPGGVMLIGDGLKDRIVAIETGDVDQATSDTEGFTQLNGILGRLAAAMGGDVPTTNLFVRDLAVNPATSRIYIVAQQYGSHDTELFWLGAGAMHRVDLSQVVYVSIAYPAFDSPGSTVKDLLWTDDAVVVAAAGPNGGPAHLVMTDTPLEHHAATTSISPFIYHWQWGGWTGEVELDRMFTYPYFGQDWVGAVFSYNPVVRYSVQDLSAGIAVAKTAFDYGSAQLVDALYYDVSGEGWVLALVRHFSDNLVHGVRVQRDILVDPININELAPRVLDFTGIPTTAGVELVTQIDGADHVERWGADKLLILRDDALVMLPLPGADG